MIGGLSVSGVGDPPERVGNVCWMMPEVEVTLNQAREEFETH